MQERKSRATAGGQREAGVVERRFRSQSHVPMVDFAPDLNTTVPSAPSSSPSPAPSLASTPAPVPSPAPALGGDDYMRSLVGLLDRLVTMQTQVPASAVVQPPAHTPRPASAAGRAPDAPQRLCRVCKSPEHTTFSHCSRENLCINCFSSGHWKRNYPHPQPATQRRPQPGGRAVGPSRPLNY